MLFAKLRRKKITFISPEIVVNFISFFIAIYVFCTWYFKYKPTTVPNERYYYLNLVNISFADPFLQGGFRAGLATALQW